MRQICVCCGFSLASALFAQDPVAVPPEAGARVAELDAKIKKLNEDSGIALANLQSLYFRALTKLQEERTKAGDLEGVLAVKTESERISENVPISLEQFQALPAELRRLRETYESATKKNAEATARGIDNLRQACISDLDAIQKRITQSGGLEQALLVKREKERLIAESPVVAEPPQEASKPAPNVADLVGTWKITWPVNGWYTRRTFKSNGTWTEHRREKTQPGKGTWKLEGDKIIMNSSDGTEEMALPKNARECKVIGKKGREMVAVKESS